MNVAITIWNDRVSPVCDSARSLLLVNVKGGDVIQKHHQQFPDSSPICQVEALLDLQVDVLICGAITMPLANVVEAQGIQIVPFVTGKVDQVLEAFLNDGLRSGEFYMPGRTGNRRARFHRRRRGHFL